MPKIITVITKNESDPWVLLNQEVSATVFTQEERDTIIAPYVEYTRALPGIQVNQITGVFQDNTFTSTLVFDTAENTSNAYQKLFGTNLDPVVVAKNSLFKNKMQNLGISYSVQVAIE